ncbi:MAG: LLM class flavin-dependent oxidoreductase [Pseudomonadota bacterium]
MRFGYWMPVFGGWLRNVNDEQMEATWDYARQLAQLSEQIGFDLTLIAELCLNDIKGASEPSLDAWSTAAALAAVTETQELMVAVRPSFHNPALFAKQAANIDHISKGRLSLNVVSSWWKSESEQYGIAFDDHDRRYDRTSEWIDVVRGLWSHATFSYDGEFYTTKDTQLFPKPYGQPVFYAGGESEAGKTLIARSCDAYLTHGDPPDVIAAKIDDMRQRRAIAGGPPQTFGVSGYVICRDTEEAAQAELDRITDVNASADGFRNFEEWVTHSKLERALAIREYSVSNRGLRSGLIGTPEQIAERLFAFEQAGVDLVLLQFSPQAEEMERFAEQVIPRFNALAAQNREVGAH